MAGIWNIPEDEPQGLLGGFQRGITNPLTLTGLGLLSGEGFGGAMQGARMGMAFDEQRRAAQQRQQYQTLLQDPSVAGAIPAPMLKVAEMAGPSSGPDFLAKFLDPAREADLAYKKALTLKAQREAANGGNKYGKTGAVFQGSDGNFYTMQFAEDGTTKVAPVQYQGQNGANPIPLTPARGVIEVGDEIIDKSTGAGVRNVGSNIQAAEFAKGKGQNDADFVGKFPKVHMSYKSFEQKTGNLIGYTDQQGKPVQGVIDRAIASVAPNTTGWQAVLRSLPASEARNLENDLKTIQANIAFGELQDMRNNSPTGGALGAVTERELDLLSSTQAALDQSQDGVRLKENLEIIKRNMIEVKRLRSEAFAADQGRYNSLNGNQGAQPPGRQSSSVQPQQQRPDPMNLFGGN